MVFRSASRAYFLWMLGQALVAGAAVAGCAEVVGGGPPGGMCFADFPCGTRVFDCVSEQRYVRLISHDCSFSCGARPCSGGTCDPTGPSVACAADRVCVPSPLFSRVPDTRSDPCELPDAGAPDGAVDAPDAAVDAPVEADIPDDAVRLDAGPLADAGVPDAVVPRCVPGASAPCACTDGRAGAQTCGASGTYGACVCSGATDGGVWDPREALRQLRAEMVGLWRGPVTSPTGWNPSSWRVELDLRDDGTYGAQCSMSPCAPFYYDVAGDGGGRRWEMRNVLLNEEGVGALWVVQSFGSALEGEISRVRISPDRNTLSFQFWATWGAGRYGPVVYSLSRVR